MRRGEIIYSSGRGEFKFFPVQRWSTLSTVRKSRVYKHKENINRRSLLHAIEEGRRISHWRGRGFLKKKIGFRSLGNAPAAK